jgi:hypothetical protein
MIIEQKKTGLPRASLWETGSFRPRPQLIRFVNTPETLCSKGFLLELYIYIIHIQLYIILPLGSFVRLHLRPTFML